MIAVPCGWDSAPLGTVCRVISGATPKTGVASHWGGEIGWVTPDDLSKDRAQTIKRGARSLTLSGYDSCSARLFPIGSVIYSSRAPIGYVAIAGGDLCTNQGCKTAVPPTHIEPRFLYWYLRWATPDIVSRASGTTFKEISGKRFGETTLAWPPIKEQRRIVDILEGHLSRLDAAATGLNHAERRAGLLRASVLAGLVVPSEARSVLDSDPAMLGQDLPPSHNLPAGWRWAQWLDVGTSENGKAFPSRDYQASGTRLLRPGNLGPNGTLRWSSASTRHLPAAYLTTHPGSVLRPDDLVMNLTAQSLKDDFLGRVCIVRHNDESPLLNQRIARLRANTIDAKYALAVFQSRLFRHYVKSLSTGSLIQHMFTTQLNRFWLPVPPESDQQKIARAADELQSDTERQIAAVRLQRRRTDLLRRSVLAAAFSGRLTRSSGLEVAEESIA